MPHTKHLAANMSLVVPSVKADCAKTAKEQIPANTEELNPEAMTDAKLMPRPPLRMVKEYIEHSIFDSLFARVYPAL